MCSFYEKFLLFWRIPAPFFQFKSLFSILPIFCSHKGEKIIKINFESKDLWIFFPPRRKKVQMSSNKWPFSLLSFLLILFWQSIDIWAQFHQCFTQSFYMRRSQMQKNDSQVVNLTLLGSTSVKAASKTLVKLTHGGT